MRRTRTALAFRMPSAKVAAAAQAEPAIAAKLAADANNYVTWAGGVLIMTGTEVIGAVGVSGAKPSAKDEACAVEGLKRVDSRLK
ncbi:MAG: heme-binding protein [Steroidobacterales bacterium]